MKELFLTTLPLIGVLIGSLISFFTTWYYTRKTDGRAVRQTAAQLAQHLDVFANKCSIVISNNDLFSRSRGAAGIAEHNIPEFTAFPMDADLKLVEPAALSRLLALPLRRDMAADLVNFKTDMESDPEAYPTDTDRQCGVLGMEAIEIAKLLRKEADLPDPEYEKYHWDISAGLSEQRRFLLKDEEET